MNDASNRPRSATRPSRGVALLVSWLWLGAGFVEARDIDRLDDYAVFEPATGSWVGVGVSFDIAPNGALQPAVTYRDTWEASLSADGETMVMNGVTRAGGRRVEYVWRFRLHRAAEKVTAEFENSLDQASTLEANLVADGKRLELRTPSSADAGDQAGVGMFLDIYLEDEDDLVIEISIRDAGGERYRSAARYRRAEAAQRKNGSEGV